MVAALAVTLTAGAPATRRGTETPALRSISSRLDGALSTVLIEASEPVAYLTSQPDPLTVLVDLRNVDRRIARQRVDREPARADRLGACRSRQRAGRRAGGARARRPRARGQASRPQLAQHDPRRGRSQRRQRSRRARRCRRSRRSPSTAAPIAAARPRPPTTRTARAAGDRPGVAEAAKSKPATQLRSVRIGKIDNGYCGHARRQRPAARREGGRDQRPAAPRVPRLRRRRRGLARRP